MRRAIAIVLGLLPLAGPAPAAPARNFGGPPLDTSGNVVGVVSSKLNAMVATSRIGDLLSTINLAAKTFILAIVLDATRASYAARTMKGFAACGN